MEKLLSWLAVRLEKYLPERPARKPKPYVPKTEKELIGVLKRTPKTVLSAPAREIIASAMNFQTTKVSDIMLPRTEITFVNKDEVLGPLMLDKLYKSGFAHFPVVDRKGQIIGVLHTQALTSLEVRETERAEKFLDRKVFYVRTDYSLEQALAGFLRTNSYFFLVVDREAKAVGLLTVAMLMRFLLGKEIADGFSEDSDLMAVAKRED